MATSCPCWRPQSQHHGFIVLFVFHLAATRTSYRALGLCRLPAEDPGWPPRSRARSAGSRRGSRPAPPTTPAMHAKPSSSPLWQGRRAVPHPTGT